LIKIVPDTDVWQKILFLRNVEDVDERRLMIIGIIGFNNRTGAKLAYGCDPICFENMTSHRIIGMQKSAVVLYI
jgi:hypothetical protein